MALEIILSTPSRHSPGLSLPLSQLSPLPSLLHIRDWSTVVASCHHSFHEWHQSLLAHVSCSVPDFPARVSTLDPLQLPTQILFDSASLHSRRRSTVSRPRRRQPLWWSDACHRALVARNGSWRDFRCSGAHEDQTRFRLMRKQLHSTIPSSRAHFWNEWLGSVRPFTAVLLGLRPLPSVAPSGPLLSHLTCATCKIPRGALSIGAPTFLHWGECFPTTSSARCLSVSRPQRTRCCAFQVPRVRARCGLPPAFTLQGPAWSSRSSYGDATSLNSYLSTFSPHALSKFSSTWSLPVLRPTSFHNWTLSKVASAKVLTPWLSDIVDPAPPPQ